MLVEKTPDYVKGSESDIRERALRIKSEIPHVKFIVVLREPAARMYSQITHQSTVH